MKKWKYFVALAAICLLAVALAGCGSSSPSTSGASTADPSSSNTSSSTSTDAFSSDPAANSSGGSGSAASGDETTTPSTTSPSVSDFSIVGVWKVTDCREQGVGQAQKGTIIKFTDQNQCNLISPSDNYILEAKSTSGEYLLSYTTVLGSSGSLTIKVIDDNTIEIHTGGELGATLSRSS